MGIKILDCTLRDGAYITNSMFGESTIRGLINQSQKAHVDIIECGWLKDADYQPGTSFFHIPANLEQYLSVKDPNILYCAMIDWDRYDVDQLPPYDGNSIDAIRVVFPRGRHIDGIAVGDKIRKKGYKVLFQAANTLAYSEKELMELVFSINDFSPVAVSIVDTFGAMYFDDLDRIIKVFERFLSNDIALGFHAHNNQQLAFALSIHFVEKVKDKRNLIVDSTLCGMGRGAGNTTTELIANYLNRYQHGNYDMNAIMDAIDIYMQKYQTDYSWGYSTPFFIAGMYQCHVNNISYLLTNHRTNARDMRTIIDSLTAEERRKYDYDLLENKYLENQDRYVDDRDVIHNLSEILSERKVLLLAPGKSTITEKNKIQQFINDNNPLVVAVNAINNNYTCDYIFFTNKARYVYAKDAYPEQFGSIKKILLSNIKTDSNDGEQLINYNLVIKRGWMHFDNAMILCLRLMNKLNVKDIYIAGFDGFKQKYNDSFADESLPTLNPENNWDELNEEIKDIYRDFYESVSGNIKITFLTDSYFDVK